VVMTELVREDMHKESLADCSAANFAGEVVALLRKQASLFFRLEGFAQRQRAMVVQEDTRPLLGLLAERQKISLELALVSRDLAPVRANWTSIRESLAATERNEADGLLSEMQESLSRIIEGDEQDARVLGVRKQIVRESLQDSQAKGVAAGAYRGSFVLAGGRLDEAL
jgi:hypothetical protein